MPFDNVNTMTASIKTTKQNYKISNRFDKKPKTI